MPHETPCPRVRQDAVPRFCEEATCRAAPGARIAKGDLGVTESLPTSLQQLVEGNGQVAHPPSGRVINGVRQCGDDTGDSNLADATDAQGLNTRSEWSTNVTSMF